MSQQASNNNFAQSPGYNGPVPRSNNQHNYASQTPVVAHKKYKWSTCFCFCVKSVTAEFVREYHKGQASPELINSSLPFWGVREAEWGSPGRRWSHEELKRIELTGRVVFGAIQVTLLVISLYYNCKASRAAASRDPSVRMAGGFKIATILGIISSVMVVINIIMLASILGLLTLGIDSIMRFYHADDLSTVLAVSIFGSLTVLILLVAMFPLCLSVHGCTNFQALAETNNMTTGYELEDTQRQLNPPLEANE